MLAFIETVLFCALVGFLVWDILTGLEKVARHLRGNPDGIKAVIEHLFLPLFAREDQRKRVTLEVIDLDKRPEEPAGSEKPSNAA
jgi:hypothetical protein